MGKVGANILISAEDSIGIHLIADSRNIFWKRDIRPFNRNEIRSLISWKRGRGSGKSRPRPYFSSPGTISQSVDSLREEIKALETVLAGSKHRWVVIDATSMPSEQDFLLIKSMMGCGAYCTVNKSPWTDFSKCKKLFSEAFSTGSLLGLNCTSGVWSDQLESIPLALREIRKIGQLVIEKRDNSSLNSFFSILNKGMSATSAISRVEQRGHLEPGAVNGFVPEIKDLENKAKIIANISGVTLKITPKKARKEDSFTPDFSAPEEIAQWYLEGKKLGAYRAPRSQLRIDIDGKEILTKMEYDGMPKTHLLARDFPWKCAFTIRTEKQSTREGFLGIGYGGAEKTAKKILWEVNRSKELLMNPSFNREELGQPLPILAELALHQGSAVGLQSVLYDKLSLTNRPEAR
jgi:hypothetical protein